MNNILKDESLIKNEGHMEVINTNFTNNYAYSYGCVLDNYCDNEKALIKDSTFKNNYSKKEGGAILIEMILYWR